MASNKGKMNVQNDAQPESEAASSKETKKDWGKISERELPEQEGSGLEGRVAGALEHPAYEEMEQKLTEAEQLAQKHYDSLLRSTAEFENLKRRMERDVANAHKFSVEKLMVDLIPVLDGLDQGLEIEDFKEAKGDVLHKVREGMELTYKILLDTLGAHGIEQVDPEGHPFDPAHHEAISVVEDIDVEPNTVLTVVQKGYVLRGRLIRPARVVVSKS